MMKAGIREIPSNGRDRNNCRSARRYDPADRFIAATAIAYDASLMTADERLLTWRLTVDRRIDAER